MKAKALQFLTTQIAAKLHVSLAVLETLLVLAAIAAIWVASKLVVPLLLASGIVAVFTTFTSRAAARADLAIAAAKASSVLAEAKAIVTPPAA